MAIELNDSVLPGETVIHPQKGTGEVMSDLGPTLLVRFGPAYEAVPRTDLSRQRTLAEQIARAEWDNPLAVINRFQAEAITSLHNEWGIFAASRITLLPHQLWVCREVNARWPTRFLVADDVGLGKTVEAGMILSPLISSGRVRRLLILCPASLVAQWQQRMLDMFDIRLHQYSTDLDTARSPFWKINDFVVASFHTLRQEKAGRQQRLLEAEPWDMVLVDEAHHLNDDETTGETLGHRLLRRLDEERRIRSLVFFTGTPHRGKTYGFLSLLSLLRPDWFDPKKSLEAQVQHLPDVLIRNNKATVTDLQGKRLFRTPRVVSETYKYSLAEAHFYNLLTDFVVRGEAYAGKLASRTESAAVMLALIALQKLAASSVAAIRRAIQRRLDRVHKTTTTLANLQKQYEDTVQAAFAGNDAANERLAELDEQIAEQIAAVALLQDEEPALRELLDAARQVQEETKIQTLLRAVEEQFAGRSVLFFTEYKATQSLLISELMRHFGPDCVTFINGGNLAQDVRFPDGRLGTLTQTRLGAAEQFNQGKVRFLVATEAAGEGIDLQARCHTLVHVDLPWNPMRLHQRVGRLNRYGQTQQVEVLTLRNPNTVESRIWDLLNEKLTRITEAVGLAMDEPEDMQQLVLGMTNPDIFRSLFRGPAQTARGAGRERLEQWFDRTTAQMGGRDVVDVVREIIGHSKRFDFAQASGRLPQVDLPDLRAFLDTALHLNNRRLLTDTSDGTLSFKTPEPWRDDLEHGASVRQEYSGLSLDRERVVTATSDNADNATGTARKQQLVGVGFGVIDAALSQARKRGDSLCLVPAELLGTPLVVFRVYSAETVMPSRPQPLIVAVSVSENKTGEQDWYKSGTDHFNLLLDGALLAHLNSISAQRAAVMRAAGNVPELPFAGSIPQVADAAEQYLLSALPTQVPHRFRYPAVERLGILWPTSVRAEG